MSYPAIDADTLAAYELDETPAAGSGPPAAGTVTFSMLDGFDLPDAPRFLAAPHSPPHFGGWVGFLEQVSGNTSSFLYDTLPNTASHYGIGLPALFQPKPRGVGFFQGTASADRDYLVLVGAPTAQLRTVSMWVQPFQGLGAAQELLHKEYQNGAPTDGVLAGTFGSPFYGAMQLFIAASNDGSWGASINVGGVLTTVTITGNTTEHVRLRYNLWNHIGATFDGTTFNVYCNGQLAGSAAVAGSLDYGAGRWVAGALADGSVSQANALMKRIRFEKVAKGLDYFFDCYTSAAGGGTGDLAILNVSPADFGADAAIAKHTPVTFTVRGSAHVLVALRYENSSERVIAYDDGFQAAWGATSTTEVVGDDINFTMLPNGGWQGSIGCFSIIAVSASGETLNFGDE